MVNYVSVSMYLPTQCTSIIALYTPHEGSILANQNRRKLGVYGRKLGGSDSLFIIVLLNITQNVTIMSNFVFSINRNEIGMRIVIHNLNIITQEDTKIQYGGTRLGRIS